MKTINIRIGPKGLVPPLVFSNAFTSSKFCSTNTALEMVFFDLKRYNLFEKKPNNEDQTKEIAAGRRYMCPLGDHSRGIRHCRRKLVQGDE